MTSPQPEPESPRGRRFRSDASRSRDGEREGPESEDFEEEYDHTDDPSLDDFIHDQTEYERRTQQAHARARQTRTSDSPSHHQGQQPTGGDSFLCAAVLQRWANSFSNNRPALQRACSLPSTGGTRRRLNLSVRAKLFHPTRRRRRIPVSTTGRFAWIPPFEVDGQTRPKFAAA